MRRNHRPLNDYGLQRNAGVGLFTKPSVSAWPKTHMLLNNQVLPTIYAFGDQPLAISQKGFLQHFELKSQ